MSCFSVRYEWAANPFQEFQALVLVLLVAGAYWWRIVRPQPSRLGFVYMLTACVVTVSGSCWATVGDDLHSPDEICGVILKASIALTACIYIELIRAFRVSRIAKATAQYRVSFYSA